MNYLLLGLISVLMGQVSCKKSESESTISADFESLKFELSGRNPFVPGKRVVLLHPTVKATEAGVSSEIFDSLNLVGTVTGLKQPLALLEGGKGKTYVVKVGDYISHDFAKIVKIEQDAVTVQRSVTNAASNRTWEFKTMKMGGQ